MPAMYSFHSRARRRPILRLAGQIEARGSTIPRQHRLVSLRIPAQTGTSLHELVFDTPSGPRVIRARRVILGLPKRALERTHFVAASVDDDEGLTASRHPMHGGCHRAQPARILEQLATDVVYDARSEPRPNVLKLRRCCNSKLTP